MSYITAIATANPPHKISQTNIAEFMVRAMQLNEHDARKLNVVFKASGIDTRHSVLKDYGRLRDFSFYTNDIDLNPFPSTKKRAEAFQQYALPLSVEAASKALEKSFVPANAITHLITVSCTGMYAPGLDIDLVDALHLRTDVQRTSINFMGCYAAFNALKVAEAVCKNDPTAKVLVVCTELCSLHFQREKSEDNMIANALFADGSAAILIEAKPSVSLSIKISAHLSELARQGDKDMAWSIGDQGFEMKLSTYVPDIIRQGIKALTHSLLSKLSISLSDVHHFAIHPGGKKIIEAIEEQLALTKEQNKWAYYVLKHYGNMSSPTVLFVLKEIFDRLTKENDQEKILSFAFGPGLTLESMLFTVHNHD
jgi:alpha-pyrone synthase